MLLDVFIFLLGLAFFIIGGRYVLSSGSEGIELSEEADRQGDRYTWSRQLQFEKTVSFMTLLDTWQQQVFS
ncbi:hypothetical protein ACUHMQ_20090 [Chitinimonas sp. PSY-7]|uniref:hypothetical protein n=1 Tax=Chitinimonas sp. PSY-7 TaxID=3459088 RepID=UPI00403FF29F